MKNLFSGSKLLTTILVIHLGVFTVAVDAAPPLPTPDSENDGSERAAVQDNTDSPQVEVVLEALNRELQNPSLRLSGCRISNISFQSDGQSTSTLIAGTIAFVFQESDVIVATQHVLKNLGHDRWLQVRADESGLTTVPPNTGPLLQQLKSAFRENKATYLRTIITDARLASDPNASEQTVLTLSGSVASKEAQDTVVFVANQVASEFFASYLGQSEDYQINVLPTDVKLVQNVEAQAFEFGRLARHALRRGRPEEAVRLLEFAAFADDRGLETMYWLALAHLESGQEDAARTVMETTIAKNAGVLEAFRRGANNEYIDLYRSLCEKQGYVRRRLQQLEREVYVEFRMPSQSAS
jgi:hypothetical protein